MEESGERGTMKQRCFLTTPLEYTVSRQSVVYARLDGGSITVVHSEDSTVVGSLQCIHAIESASHQNSAEVHLHCLSMTYRYIDSASTCRHQHRGALS
jgi:hypothetical protein